MGYAAPAPRASSAGAWIAFGVVGLLVFFGCVGAGIWFAISTVDDDRSTRDDSRSPEAFDDAEEVDEEADEEADEDGDDVAPTSAVARARVVTCNGARALDAGALGQHLGALGWQITGTLRYCAGDMINFVCKGGEGHGVTAKRDGETASAAAVKFASPADARRYIDDMDSSNKAVTLASDGNVVLYAEMADGEADRLLNRACR
jgi:hypothetical protein